MTDNRRMKMCLEDIIAKELKIVKENKAVYEVECSYYGNDYVNNNKDKFDCVAQLDYHLSILILLMELCERRNNEE